METPNTNCKACREESNGRSYCHQCETVAVYRGYAKWQLFEAFGMVEDKTNWKNPIDVRVSKMRADSKRLVEAAVIFYTGSTPEFRDTENHTFVKAAGYYAAVGA